MARSNYSWHFADGGNVLVIIDLDMGGKSVTNDMENVLADIAITKDKDLSGMKIIYRDSDNIFDGVKAINHGNCIITKYSISFIRLGAASESEAITAINLYNK